MNRRHAVLFAVLADFGNEKFLLRIEEGFGEKFAFRGDFCFQFLCIRFVPGMMQKFAVERFGIEMPEIEEGRRCVLGQIAPVFEEPVTGIGLQQTVGTACALEVGEDVLRAGFLFVQMFRGAGLEPKVVQSGDPGEAEVGQNAAAVGGRCIGES